MYKHSHLPHDYHTQIKTPPLVAFQARTRYVGEAAVSMATRFPKQTIGGLKATLLAPESAPTLPLAAYDTTTGEFRVQFELRDRDRFYFQLLYNNLLLNLFFSRSK